MTITLYWLHISVFFFGVSRSLKKVPVTHIWILKSETLAHKGHHSQSFSVGAKSHFMSAATPSQARAKTISSTLAANQTAVCLWL